MSENQDIGGGNDTEFWRLVLESYQQSGLSVKQFCTRESISPSSFYNWQKRLAGKGAQQPAKLSQAEPALSEEIKAQPTFLEVGAIKSLRSQLRITFPSGICVHAGDGCDLKLFREAIDILVEKRC
jgi:hypothetical protein